MNSVWLLYHTTDLSTGDGEQYVVSAHPTESSAKNAERFFRGYDERFVKHGYHETWIEEVDFEV